MSQDDAPTLKIVKLTLRTPGAHVGVTADGRVHIYLPREDLNILIPDGEEAYEFADGIMRAYDFMNGL